MMKGKILISLLVLFSAWTASAQAEESILENDQVAVQFEEPLRGAAKEVLRVYPAVRGELEKTLGRDPRLRPVVRLVRTSDSFRRLTESDLVVALAVPARDLIVIDYSKMNIHPLTLETTLKHELCHLQLHHRIQERNLPRWLDEGICQWVTGGVAEIVTDGSRSALKEAVLSNRFLSIDEMTARFPSGGRELLLAYEESESIVEYINKEFGPSAVMALLMQLGEGNDPDNAVAKAFGITLPELERRWRSYLVKKGSWIAYLSGSLYELLFLLAAIVTVCGFVRVMRRKRDYRDEEEDGESDEERK
jgi:hypothetical protein